MDAVEVGEPVLSDRREERVMNDLDEPGQTGHEQGRRRTGEQHGSHLWFPQNLIVPAIDVEVIAIYGCPDVIAKDSAEP